MTILPCGHVHSCTWLSSAFLLVGNQAFSSDLASRIVGDCVSLDGVECRWLSTKQLQIPVALHIVECCS